MMRSSTEGMDHALAVEARIAIEQAPRLTEIRRLIIGGKAVRGPIDRIVHAARQEVRSQQGGPEFDVFKSELSAYRRHEFGVLDSDSLRLLGVATSYATKGLLVSDIAAGLAWGAFDAADNDLSKRHLDVLRELTEKFLSPAAAKSLEGPISRIQAARTPTWTQRLRARLGAGDVSSGAREVAAQLVIDQVRDVFAVAELPVLAEPRAGTRFRPAVTQAELLNAAVGGRLFDPVVHHRSLDAEVTRHAIEDAHNPPIAAEVEPYRNGTVGKQILVAAGVVGSIMVGGLVDGTIGNASRAQAQEQKGTQSNVLMDVGPAASSGPSEGHLVPAALSVPTWNDRASQFTTEHLRHYDNAFPGSPQVQPGTGFVKALTDENVPHAVAERVRDLLVEGRYVEAYKESASRATLDVTGDTTTPVLQSTMEFAAVLGLNEAVHAGDRSDSRYMRGQITWLSSLNGNQIDGVLRAAPAAASPTPAHGLGG